VVESGVPLVIILRESFGHTFYALVNVNPRTPPLPPPPGHSGAFE